MYGAHVWMSIQHGLDSLEILKYLTFGKQLNLNIAHIDYYLNDCSNDKEKISI